MSKKLPQLFSVLQRLDVVVPERGRLAINIPFDVMKSYLLHGLKVKDIAKLFGVSCQTIHQSMISSLIFVRGLCTLRIKVGKEVIPYFIYCIKMKFVKANVFSKLYYTEIRNHPKCTTSQMHGERLLLVRSPQIDKQ